MAKCNVIAVDLAKSTFHVCVRNSDGEVIFKREFTRQKLKEWLTKQPPPVFAVEACGGAHYWAKVAEQAGHTPVLVKASYAASFRQGHKTDYNDAEAIAIAAVQSNRKPIQVKTDEQLALQACERIREHYQSHKVASSNLMRGVLLEFGIVFGKGDKHLRTNIPEILEDAENTLPHILRAEIYALFEYWQQLCEQLNTIKQKYTTLTQDNKHCQQLMALEGVGPVNALGLYLALGADGKGFKNGRDAAACIGVTPVQYSSGGKTVMLGISRKAGNKQLRSKLIQGAMAVASSVNKRSPKNTKEQWLKDLIERRGLRRAAVALVNKTIRTAWAMLHYGKDYQTPAAIAA